MAGLVFMLVVYLKVLEFMFLKRFVRTYLAVAADGVSVASSSVSLILRPITR